MAGSNEKRTLNIRAILVDEISNQLGDIKREIKRTGDVQEKANKKASGSWRKVKVAIGGAIAAIGVWKGLGLAKRIAGETDEIGKLAIATGETVEQVSDLAAAFQFSGGKSDQFKSVLSSLLASQRGAIKGTKEQVEAFGKFGISIQKLRSLSPGGVLRELSNGYDKIKDSTERTLVFASLFPEQWRNVINLVEGGGDAFERRLDQARRAGATVTSGQARIAATITDSFFRARLALENLGRELIDQFGPGLAFALQAFAESLIANKQTIIAIGKAILTVIQTAVTFAFDAISGLIGKLEQLGLVGTRDEDKAIRSSAINARIKALEQLENSILGQISNYRDSGIGTDKLSGDLQMITEQLGQAQEDLFQNVATNVQKLARFRDSFVEALARIKAGGDIVKPDPAKEGTDDGRRYSGAFTKAYREGLLKAAELLGGVIGKAREKLQGLGDPVLITSFTDGWTDAMTRLKARFLDFGRAVSSALTGAISSGINSISTELGNVIAGTKSAKEAMKDFARTALNVVSQLIAKLLVLKIAQIAVGGTGVALAKGGVLPGVSHDSSALPTRKYAKGGIAKRPQLAVFGEGSRNEAFVPLPDNRSIPVSFTGGSGGGGGGGVMNITIHAMDAKDVSRALVENQDTLRSIWQSQAESQQGMRQTISQASR
jgi:hypothetical protein